MIVKYCTVSYTSIHTGGTVLFEYSTHQHIKICTVLFILNRGHEFVSSGNNKRNLQYDDVVYDRYDSVLYYKWLR